MTNKLLKISYTVFVILSLILCFYLIWINALAVLDIASGKDNLLTQITTLSGTQAMVYSTAYLVLFLTLMIFLISFLIKPKKRKAIIASILVLILTIIELITDSLFHISV